MEMNFVHGGVLTARLKLFRPAKGGLVVTIKTDPAIEDFMRSLGDGGKRPIAAYGKQWSPVPNAPALEIYNMEVDRALFNGNRYRLDKPGSALDLSQEVAPDCVNLSFLRIPGTSEGDGVSFALSGVFGRDGLRDLYAKINAGIKHLYMDFIRPIELTADLVRIVENEVAR